MTAARRDFYMRILFGSVPLATISSEDLDEVVEFSYSMGIVPWWIETLSRGASA